LLIVIISENFFGEGLMMKKPLYKIGAAVIGFGILLFAIALGTGNSEDSKTKPEISVYYSPT